MLELTVIRWQHIHRWFDIWTCLRFLSTRHRRYSKMLFELSKCRHTAIYARNAKIQI